MSEITVSFLDVGQGDSAVIILPDKTSAIVIDCFSIEVIGTYLERKSINRLSHVFLTHTDFDHAKDMPELLENFAYNGTTFLFNPDTLYPQEKKNKRLFLRKLTQLMDRRGLEIFNPRTGHGWNIQGVLVEVLHPSSGDITRAMVNDETNNASILLRVIFAKQSLLFAADIIGDGWQWIMERSTNLKADIFKFPHHGGWYNASDQQPTLSEILQLVRPSLVILSVGTGNKYNHPDQSTLDLLWSNVEKLRFICTQATVRCHSLLGYQKSKPALGCGGTIEVIINEKPQIEVVPDEESHLKIIRGLDRPQCMR